MAFADALSAADRAAAKAVGRVVQYTSFGQAAVDVQGIFEPRFRRPDTTERGVEIVGPTFFPRLVDLPRDPVGDSAIVTVDGIEYTIREAQKDGQGGVLLHLQKRY